MPSSTATATNWLCSPLLVVTLAALTLAPLSAQTNDDPARGANPLLNFSFEEGDIGEPPAGWRVPLIAGYRVAVTDEQPSAGKRCAVIERDTNPGPGQFGNLLQAIDATPFRGKRVRFRGAVRAEVAGAGNRAQLWFRVDRTPAAGAASAGAFDNMADRPISSATWRHYEIVGDVEDDAQRIVVGMLLAGKGKAWLDDVTFEVVGQDVAATAKPRQLPAIDRIGPGLFEIVGSARLTPIAGLLRERRAEDRPRDRQKASPMTVLIPLPLAYRDQAPLGYEFSVDPPNAEDAVQIYEDKPHNYVVKLVLADVLNRKRIDVKFRSAVLVGPSSVERGPGPAPLPDEWPEEARPWLAATWCADAEHERIRAIAKEIRFDTDDAMQIISRVEQRAKEIFRSAEGRVGNLTAVEALDKRGSCTSCANLVAALLRASGVPARILSGYPSWSGPLQTHYLVEAYVPQHGWHPIESTMCRSPWPNTHQVNVAIVPTEYEQQPRADARRFAGGGVPYLSLTEMPDNPGSVLLRGTIDESRNCDHQCQALKPFEERPDDWRSAIQWGQERWKRWLAEDHKLSGAGTLSFGKAADRIEAASLAALRIELDEESASSLEPGVNAAPE